jgi:hypothetical protein
MVLSEMMRIVPFAAVAFSAPALSSPGNDFVRYAVPVANVREIPSPRDPTYRYFRTVFRNGLKGGANFAGHITLIIAGCGAGCVNGWFVDRRNGRVINAPVTGENFPVLRYETKPTSRLLKAEWIESDLAPIGEGCIQQDFVWEHDKFKALSRAHKSRCESEDHKP